MADCYDVTGNILRDTPVSDGAGGQTSSWGTVATGVAARHLYAKVAPTTYTGTGSENRAVVDEWLVFAQPHPDIRRGDEWVEGSTTYPVISVQTMKLTKQAQLAKGLGT